MQPPLRIYEPNIIHNPLKWFGVWTPQGWRVHEKRWGNAECVTVRLNGDGQTTFFPEALKALRSGKVEWQDDLHLADDSFTDGGIYPCDPRVEYPPGQPRWAISHTLLCYPVADHTLYTHEYTWDMRHGYLQTHFRKHVLSEECCTDGATGLTVRVKHRPISTGIEGNVQYPLLNSAVRGVWHNADKSGRNLYARRVVQLLPMHNAVYGIIPQTPVVQCHGVWKALPEDPLGDLFDSGTGFCRDERRLIEQLRIHIDEPRIGMIRPKYHQVHSLAYEGEVSVPAAEDVVVDEAYLERIRSRLGARFQTGRVGYGATGIAGQDAAGYPGYDANYDLNGDGVIDARDLDRAAVHLGKTVRHNRYLSGYFGGDWVSTGSGLLEPEHRPGIPVIVDYEYGGGYDAEAGVIHLLKTPGPNQPVWVEYVHDVPAEPGEGNIVVHLYRER